MDDPAVSSEVKSLVMHMEEFSFLVCLIVWHDLLFEVNLVSKTLQGKTTDISLAANQLKKCIEFVEKFQDSGLNDSITKAKDIAIELILSPPLKRKDFELRKSFLLTKAATTIRQLLKMTSK